MVIVAKAHALTFNQPSSPARVPTMQGRWPEEPHGRGTFPGGRSSAMAYGAAAVPLGFAPHHGPDGFAVARGAEGPEPAGRIDPELQVGTRGGPGGA